MEGPWKSLSPDAQSWCSWWLLLISSTMGLLQLSLQVTSQALCTHSDTAVQGTFGGVGVGVGVTSPRWRHLPVSGVSTSCYLWPLKQGSYFTALQWPWGQLAPAAQNFGLNNDEVQFQFLCINSAVYSWFASKT